MEVKPNPSVWFEIPVTDLKRAKGFYEKVLSEKLTTEKMGKLKMAMFPSSEKGWGSSGSLVQGEGYEPCGGGPVVYFTVKDIEDTLGRITKKGGKVLLPKTSIGKWGFIAQFEDTEGNRLALHSMS